MTKKVVGSILINVDHPKKREEEEKSENRKKNGTTAMTVRIFCPSHYRK